MASIKNLSAGSVSSIDVADDTFGERMNPVVLREAVEMYEANKRVGTVNTLSRRFVNGTSKKFMAQKGSGRARHGDRKAPLFRGGGVAHGPHPRDYRYALPRKALTRALRIALAGKLRDGELCQWSSDGAMKKPSTKDAKKALGALGAEGGALIAAAGDVDRNLLLSVRNLPRVSVLPAREITAYDVVSHRYVVLLNGALDLLVDRVGADSQGDEA